MLLPGVLPDISALIPEIVAGNPELSGSSQVGSHGGAMEGSFAK